LNVFPITVPPLRERREDIPLLARWFAQNFTTRFRKPIESIPARTLIALSEYHWPGSVRELENVNRARRYSLSRPEVMLPEFKFHLAHGPPAHANDSLKLEEAEGEHIPTVLRDAN